MKILVAVDGSPCSEAAVAEVSRMPWPPESEVRLITVDAPFERGLARDGLSSAFEEVVKQQRAEDARRLHEAAEKIAQAAPSLRVTTAMLEGWPKDAIVAEAERWGADLVVVGSHGYGPIRRFFLGSVSLYVAHHAPCSVMVVRQPAKPPQAEEAPAKP